MRIGGATNKQGKRGVLLQLSSLAFWAGDARCFGPAMHDRCTHKTMAQEHAHLKKMGSKGVLLRSRCARS